VIDADARQHRAIGVHDIDRIEPAAEPHFQDRCLGLFFRKEPKRGEGAVLEIGERHLAASRFHRGEGFAKCLVARFRAGDAHALVVRGEMRRGIERGSVAARAQHRLEHRAGRALAVRAAHGDRRTRQGRSQFPVNRGHAVEPQRDRLRMLALDIGEPVGQGSHARLCS
jgi:hypothetical protein